MSYFNRVLVLIALSLFAGSALAEIILTPVNNPIAQQASDDCGAAAIQTIMGAYPTAPCSTQQFLINDELQKPANQGQGFFKADPDGVANVLNDVVPLFGCPSSSAHWVVFAQNDANFLTYQMAFWMKNRKYPVAALYRTSSHNADTSHREHWVTVYQLDVGNDPNTTSDIALNTVSYLSQVEEIDPSQPNLVIDNFVDGALWLADFQKVSIPTAKYDGKFVAVIEPPKRDGRVRVTPFAVTGTPISADRASTEARRFVRGLESNPRFRELTTLDAQRPMLVNPERGGYYVIPFARRDQAPTAAVIVNAYNGRFMKVGRFPARPMQTDREAIGRALRYLGRENAQQVRASLVALPEDGTTYFPRWRVVADGQEVFVGQDGRIRAPEPPAVLCANLKQTIVTGAATGWKLVSGPGVTAPRQPVVVSPVASWASIPNVPWVSVDAQRGNRIGDYVYEAEFCLCAKAKNPRITLRYLADNGAKVLLNGKQIHATTGNTNFQSPIKSVGFAGAPGDWVIPGINKVRVIVTNESSVTGLAASLEIQAESGGCPGN